MSVGAGSHPLSVGSLIVLISERFDGVPDSHHQFALIGGGADKQILYDWSVRWVNSVLQRYKEMLRAVYIMHTGINKFHPSVMVQ